MNHLVAILLSIAPQLPLHPCKYFMNVFLTKYVIKPEMLELKFL